MLLKSLKSGIVWFFTFIFGLGGGIICYLSFLIGIANSLPFASAILIGGFIGFTSSFICVWEKKKLQQYKNDMRAFN